MTNEGKKVFISYSWTVQQQVIELAERLIANGIDVVLDVYDLKEGQDKYAFMEKSVYDESIDRVLIICDKTYAEKANDRIGGVGDETVIISQEVYGQVKQEKFIPIIFELDEDGKAYVPHYIKSRIYIDLSCDNNRYEEEYEKLLRNIYEKPIFKKPVLGQKPEWLENEAVDLSATRDIVKQIRGYTGGNPAKVDFLLRKAVENFMESAKNYTWEDFEDLLSAIDSTKPFRDLFVDFCEALIYSSLDISSTICSFFENFYNGLHDATGRHSYSDKDFELYDYLIWEFFITSTAMLLNYEKYKELHSILTHTYFLRTSFFENTVKPFSYFKFRKYLSTIEEICKPKSDTPNVYTLSGKILIGREKKPHLTKLKLANADIVLYQLGCILDIAKDEWGYWFPTSYVYHEETQSIWQKLKSMEYCEKMLPLFGVETIDELKTMISNCQYNRDMGYRDSYFSAPAISSVIKPEDIGTLK